MGGWLGGWLGGWVGGVEEWRIKPSQLSTKLKLKLKLSLAIVFILIYNLSIAKPKTQKISRMGGGGLKPPKIVIISKCEFWKPGGAQLSKMCKLQISL